MYAKLTACAVLCLSLLVPQGAGAQFDYGGQTVENLYLAAEHVARGKQYMAMNLWTEAEQEFWAAVGLDYGNSMARQGLGDVYREMKLYDQAIENYQIVLQNQPNNVDIQYQISLSYYDNHAYEKARVAAAKALQMNPELAKAENLVRLSEADLEEQRLEIQRLADIETAAIERFRQEQEVKESAFIGKIVPGWKMIQTGETRQKWTGYTILGATAGLLVGGWLLRGKGQTSYDEASMAISREVFQDRVDLGQTRYKVGGYMIDAAFGIFALNLVDSFLLGGRIFGGKTKVKPSLPERDRISRH
ncbi:MAG: tetratricopeptide repeat protein [Candidatus Glassbacteria bacterium]|nr:tetratricopeptide repeat protein [Candidatus Glassbacteria bacterium]